MLAEEEYKVDKAGWPDGPWMHEPDRTQWRTESGLPGLIVRSYYSGALCGYVAVAPGHPAYECHYDAVPAEVHGGLTYSDHCRPPICHIPEPGEPDDVWWLGFDCAHAYDFIPKEAAVLQREAHDWDLAYVKSQVEDLAWQLRQMVV
ncbi:MAG TPA: hypothetical protein VG476_04520 [Acidimicrobiales bacterium]|nr:hypothetical protein [Acidimicrobiales bacterium]